MKATESLLKQKHVNEISVKDIAERAEFSVGYLYKLFPNKEEIFVSIVRTKLHKRYILIQYHLSGTNQFRDAFRLLIHALIEWQKRNIIFNPGVLETFSAIMETRPEVLEYISEHEQQIRALLKTFFQRGIDEGVIFAGDTDLIIDSFEALMKGFLIMNLRHTLGDGSPDSPWVDYAPTIFDMILKTFDVSWNQHRSGCT